MNKKKILKLLCIASTLLWVSCGKKEKQELIRPVKIQEIKTNANENLILDFPAKVSSTNETTLAFKYAGTIKEIKFKKGDFVKKGSVIVVMDSQDYKLNLEVFSKKYEAAKAVADNAKLQFARAEKLYKAKALSQRDYDDAKAKTTVALSMFKEAQAGLQNAKNTLKDTKIIAPYDGYIDRKIVDVGTVVSAGFPVISFISNNISDIKINVALRDVKNLEAATKILFKDDRTSETYPLKIKNISQTPDVSKLTYPITLTFDKAGETDKKFSAGETGTVQVQVEKKLGKEILLPLSAVFEKDNETNVYLLKDNKAIQTKVKIGNLSQTRDIVILDGLKNGDKVITAGVSKLNNGEKVKILKQDLKNN